MNLQVIKKHIRELVQQNSCVIAVSGGVDSMALLDICRQTIPHTHIIVAHFNHNIRNDAHNDAQLIQQYCTHYGLCYEYGESDIPAQSLIQKKSLEECGRIERYHFLRTIRQQYNAQWILTAHHIDDHIETILLHMLRGASLHGLSGLKTVCRDVIRPLLSCYKEDLETYCASQHVPFRTDSTNCIPNTSRNKLRLEILPLLQEINPGVVQTILRNNQQLRSVEEYMEGQISHLSYKSIQQTVFRTLPEVLQRIYIQKLYEYYYGSTENLSFQLIDSIRSFMLQSTTGKKKQFGKTYDCYNDYGVIYIISHDSDAISLHSPQKLVIPGETTCGIYTIRTTICSASQLPKRYCISYDQVANNVLYCRFWKQGDAIIPFGMKRKKKLQDIFTDKKITKYMRRKIPLIVDEHDTILAVYNVCINDTVKATKQTKRILCFDFQS